MTIIVEDGTGLTDANSYISINEADNYHLLYNNTSWGELSEAEKEVAILKAMRYIEYTYSFNGNIATETQALSWPRIYIYDKEGRTLDNIIPTMLKNAVCELALLSLTNELFNSSTSASDYVVKEKVGPIEIQYKDNSSLIKQFQLIDNFLYGFFSSKISESFTRKLERV